MDGPLQRFMLRIPTIGTALQTVALARLAWVMSQTMNTSMDLRRSLKLSLQSTRNAWYIDRIEAIDAQIAAGNSIYEAFSAAGGFPPDFLESIHVGEQSGNLVESMGQVSNVYQEQAREAFNVLATGRFCRMGGGRGNHHLPDLPPGHVLHRHLERGRPGLRSE